MSEKPDREFDEFRESVKRGLDDVQAGRFVHFDSDEEIDLPPDVRAIVEKLDQNTKLKEAIQRSVENFKAGRHIHFNSADELFAEIRRLVARMEKDTPNNP